MFILFICCLAALLVKFQKNSESKRFQEALRVYNITATKVSKALLEYYDRVLKKNPRWSRMLLAVSEKEFFDTISPTLFNYLRPWLLKTTRTLLATKHADLRNPPAWFPQTRAMKRHIIYHAGPTNSGKTFHAIEALKKAKSGLYCAPLRLLAFEIYERLNYDGIYCTLLTGQEHKHVPGAMHASCTIEMARRNANQQVDVAVIDEIQMIGDENRGWAWTEALLSLEAHEIHLCGDASALLVVQRLVKNMGDTMEVVTYERLTPLCVSEKALLGDLKQIKRGDCVVAFSRREIFQLKRKIEELTPLKCCVVYGNLPPEIRSLQAKLFNQPDSPFDVLVASDAVGMGLNLNIKRIVFESLSKFDGERIAEVSPSSIKQIAGRAGRARSLYPDGEVTCLMKDDLQQLQRSMASKLGATRFAGVFPTFEILERFAALHPHLGFLAMVKHFFDVARYDSSLYFPCEYSDFLGIAEICDPCQNMSFEEKYYFSTSPMKLDCPLMSKHFVNWIRAFNVHRCVYLDCAPGQLITNKLQLAELESFFLLADLYVWLGQRLPGFVDIMRVLHYRELAIKTFANFLLDTSLTRTPIFDSNSNSKVKKQPGKSPERVIHSANLLHKYVEQRIKKGVIRRILLPIGEDDCSF